MLLSQRRKLVVVTLTIAFLVMSAFPFASAQSKISSLSAKQIPRLVDVGAKSCIPCKMMASILDELRQEYSGALAVDFIDVREYPDAAQEYKIRGIPTQIFYDANGKERGRHLGFISKEDILNTFQKMGIALKKPDGQAKK